MKTSPMPRRALCGLLLAAAAGAAFAAAAERVPARPITLIVAFAPGTGSDAVARIVAGAMATALGRPVIVDNRSGAAGALGTEQGARAAADGSTLTLATTSTLLTLPALNPKLRYHPDEDFVPVAGLARTPFVLVTADTAQAPHSLAELKARLAGAGGAFGSAGNGTITHLAAEYFVRQAGVQAVHVPYRGSGQALSDVAGGQVLFACDTPAAALPLIRGGKLRALAVSAPQRLPSLPGVPTGAEAGMPAFELSAWWGLVAPAATPSAVVAALSHAVLQALAAPEVRQQLEALQVQPLPLNAAAFGALMHREAPFWAGFVRRSGLRLEP
ncbi:MAG TPA: tripartite tricarboxylate transporter substrate-binding protein [Rubrivivax sp.]|nr:tripartite tricarboxylate transporter substrate-binding protein [Rubrivivax sp.]HPO18467.1 tripartite tricarboxylate transporter substrate-binding protein [Rubrivivax sp.]